MNKDVVMIVCILLAVGASVLAVFSFEKQNKMTKSLEEERYMRMVSEESSQKSAAKMATLQVQLKSAEEKAAKIKDILDHEKGVNEDLKNQYEDLERTKAKLEARLLSAVQEKIDTGSPLPEDQLQPSAEVLSTPAASGAGQ